MIPKAARPRKRGPRKPQPPCIGMGGDYADIAATVRRSAPVPDVLLDLRQPSPSELILAQCWSGALRDAALAPEVAMREDALDWIGRVVSRLPATEDREAAHGPLVVSLLDLLVAVADVLVEASPCEATDSFSHC